MAGRRRACWFLLGVFCFLRALVGVRRGLGPGGPVDRWGVRAAATRFALSALEPWKCPVDLRAVSCRQASRGALISTPLSATGRGWGAGCWRCCWTSPGSTPLLGPWPSTRGRSPPRETHEQARQSTDLQRRTRLLGRCKRRADRYASFTARQRRRLDPGGASMPAVMLCARPGRCHLAPAVLCFATQFPRLQYIKQGDILEIGHCQCSMLYQHMCRSTTGTCSLPPAAVSFWIVKQFF